MQNSEKVEEVEGQRYQLQRGSSDNNNNLNMNLQTNNNRRNSDQSSQLNNMEIIRIPDSNFGTRRYYQIIWDAFKHSPFDFLAAWSFSLGSLFYVISALMYIRWDDDPNAPIVGCFGPALDLLSGVFYFMGWRNAWQDEMRSENYQKYDNLRDFNLYSIILFKFSSVSYLIEQSYFVKGMGEEDMPYNIDLQASTTLLISSILSLYETLGGYLYDNKVDVRISRACKITRINQVRQYKLCPSLKKLPDDDAYSGNKKYIYWLVWADSFYVFGAFLYFFYSFIQYFYEGDEKNLKENYCNLFGSILFMVDCFLYIAGFVQGEDQSSYFQQEDAQDQDQKQNSIKNIELQSQNHQEAI